MVIFVGVLAVTVVRWCMILSPQEVVEGSAECIGSGRGCSDLGEVAFGDSGRALLGAWLPRAARGGVGGRNMSPAAGR